MRRRTDLLLHPDRALLAASATSQNPITGWVVYVDDIAAFRASMPSVNTTLTLTPGTHWLTVRAWDTSGANGSTIIGLTAQ